MDDDYQRDGNGVNSDGVVSFAFFLTFKKETDPKVCDKYLM